MKASETPEKGIVEKLRGKWDGLRPLEKVGVVAIGTAGAVVAAAVVAPSLASATAGGALAAAGAHLLAGGFRG